MSRIIVSMPNDMMVMATAINAQLKDGRAYTGSYPYERLLWNYDGLVERLRASGPKYPINGVAGLAAMIDLCRTTNQMATIDPLIKATIPR